MSLELPRRLLADRLTALLVLGCGATIEAVLWRQPGLPAGAGIAIAGVLLAWQAWRTRRAPRAAEWGPNGWRLRLADGGWTAARLGHGSRLLGPSVVLHWQSQAQSFRVWLTPADLPASVLRSLALRLRAHGSRVAK